ncbi:MAG TPA: hypothetical protein VEJ63_08605 [Planctomycetota bacterium]|nr:hypothetical protein [Planctomycetota bacterium]
MAKLDKTMVIYRVKRGAEKKFEQLLKIHWPTLNKLKLVSGEPSLLFRGERYKRTFYVEIFSWKSVEAVSHAHHLPEVMKIWEPMSALVEEWHGRSGMEFANVGALNFHQKGRQARAARK